MIRNKYRVLELACIVLLMVFVVFLFISRSGGTQKPLKEITPAVLKVADISEMKKKSAADAATVFDFDTEKELAILYYDNENIMNCSALLIVKLKDETDAPVFKEHVEAYVDNQKNLFKNYAPDQYALLSGSVIEVSGNILFYCTAPNADEVYAAFKKAL